MPSAQPTRARITAACITVILTVVAVWLFVDYRTQPPEISKKVTSDM
jgi:hypothetical protein